MGDDMAVDSCRNLKFTSRRHVAGLFALLAGIVGVAGGSAQAPAVTRAQAPKAMRLYVFDCGRLNISPEGVARYHVTPAEVGETRMPVPCFLIAHPKGTLMWDVGVIPDATVEYDVFGDGLAVIKSAPGHTPGH